MMLFRFLILVIVGLLVFYYITIILHVVSGFYPFKIEFKKAVIPFYCIVKLFKNKKL
jgi:hypothetical protein